MVFSSPIFLFGFLPLVLLFYYIVPKSFKNVTLLIFSLFFYAWGEVFYLLIMLLSIICNYSVGYLLDKYNNSKNTAKFILFLGVGFNIGILFLFKYFNFFIENINILLDSNFLPILQKHPIHLPIGISFFTFQAISYIADVYSNKIQYQRKFTSLALYISLFPQLIAGPIVRYSHIHQQIKDRIHSNSLFVSGINRFIYGLAKKVLIANTLADVADSIFAIPEENLSWQLAWLGIITYALQIYFDFSGYSDMAIGLGRMFGFTFLENFNYPYISKNIREFWRRWHISLSTWFRDYVYIPLGGSRVKRHIVYRNLFIVFFLTGFWHGASWNFLIWGMIHGSFICIERLGFDKTLNKLWQPLQHFYLLLVVLVSWVFFRIEDFDKAINFLQVMFNPWMTIDNISYSVTSLINNEYMIVLILSILFSFPLFKKINSTLETKFNVLKYLIPIILLLLCIIKISGSTYNPFIYFRF